MASQRPAKASVDGSRLVGSNPTPSAQFGLSIVGGASDFVSIGRTVPFPLYFMHRSGRAVLRMSKWGPTAEHGVAGKDRDELRKPEETACL